MKILCHTDPKGTIGYVAMQSNGSALKLAGNCFGILKISHQKAKVVRLLSPIEPSAIICIGSNYRRHAQETNAKIPEYPVVFFKGINTAMSSASKSRELEHSRIPSPTNSYLEVSLLIPNNPITAPADGSTRSSAQEKCDPIWSISPERGGMRVIPLCHYH